MNWKLKFILLIIFILGVIIFAIYPRYIGNNNPLNGLVYHCFGYKFKKTSTFWTRGGVYDYYCLGIPYDYNASGKCFRPYFIGGHCNFGL